MSDFVMLALRPHAFEQGLATQGFLFINHICSTLLILIELLHCSPDLKRFVCVCNRSLMQYLASQHTWHCRSACGSTTCVSMYSLMFACLVVV